ncbi:MAG: cache domain-containing protein [Bacteroidales bacterium]|nr:cache domain-containing protein [Bacteroidales bacterium]
MNTHKIIFFLIVLFPLVFFASCDKETNIYKNDMVSQYELDKAIVQTNTTNVATGLNNIFNTMIGDSTGRAHLCQAFVNDALFFNDESGYFFIETMDDAWVVAHVNPDLIGTSRINTQDIYGKFFIQDMVSTVKYIGYGFVEYYRKNPSNNEIERKLSFVTGIPSAELFIGTGFYGDLPPIFYEKLDANMSITETITKTTAKGIGSVLSEIYSDSLQGVEFCRNFIKHIRFFDDQSGYFFIYDFRAYNVAHATQPNLQGQNLYDYQDTHGNYVIRNLIQVVQTKNSGFSEYYWNNPTTSKEEKKIAFVIKIPGSDYFIGSGVYLDD